MTVCACVRECVSVRVGAPMHSLVPSVSCPSAGNVLALSYLFFFCLSLSLLLHVRLYADLMSICVCAGVFSGVCVCVCAYSNDRHKAAIWWVGKRVVKRFGSLTFCGVVERVCTRARARSLSLSVSGSYCLSLYLFMCLSVCLSVGTHWFVFRLCTLRMFSREMT